MAGYMCMHVYATTQHMYCDITTLCRQMYSFNSSLSITELTVYDADSVLK